MSGHSKWSTIKRQKGVNDAKRGLQFTKLANAITIAVRQGGGTTDPAMNFRLRLAIDAARTMNMPKDNIERAVQRAAGKQGTDVIEATYEGFGPGGFSVIVETVTDNKQRTVSDVKNIFEKNGGTIGNPGSVSYQFQQRGLITIAKGSYSSDEIFLIAADQGAEDVEEAGQEVLVYTKPDALAKVRDSLQSEDLKVSGAELVWKPIVLLPLTEKGVADRALGFLDKLEELDDVQKVYANFDIPDSLFV